ncbi:MAG: anaerobic ribonucleoside-triphosphate reductase activating protein [Euryarchaeota archaeon]|uniref:anaerobic ribonucleoside-triphosphate reductase activating protein n=1 Tax=Methanobacterium sp. MZD130B TaxID=3394378 RepID=UPI0039FCD6B6|nr:anaerobic ribonucleoside-triphosphate reductase activating protein [Euryarchaeota archaeon]
MRIGGHITSTLEFPGHMSIVFFTAGCNLLCSYCHNPELIDVDGGEDIPLKELYRIIQDSSDFIDAVVITGGEPLLQSDDAKKLLECCHDYDLKTKLDTNGCYPKKLKKIIDVVDYVALDVKAPFDAYKEIIGDDVGDLVKKSMELCYDSDCFLECRTTYVPSLMNPEDMEKIAKEITCDLYTIQQFRNRTVLDEKLQNTPNTTRKELLKIANKIKPFLDNVKIKTGEFGDEIIK